MKSSDSDPKVLLVGDLVEDIVAILQSELMEGGQAEAQIVRTRGGSAANIATILAQLGVNAGFVGSVGDDVTGEWLVNELRGSGVVPYVSRRHRSATVLCLVNPGGERSFISDTTSASSRKTDDLDHASRLDASWLHLSGYWLFGGVNSSQVYSAIQRHSSKGGRVSVDIGSYSRAERYGIGHLRHSVGHLPDVIFANRQEADCLGLSDNLDISRMTIITDGPHSVKVFHRDSGRCEEYPVLHVSDVVDTVGAGDAFTAGVLSMLMERKSIGAAVNLGTKLSAAVVQGIGANLNLEQVQSIAMLGDNEDCSPGHVDSRLPEV